MHITVAIGLDQLHELPVAIRRQIHVALRLPEHNQQPEQQQNMGGYQTVPAPQNAPQQFTQQPVQQQATPPYQPPQHTGPPPIMSGNTMIFPAAMGGLDQINAAKDVLTGQVAQVPQFPTTPPVPQVNNAPVNVAPVAIQGPPAATQHPGIRAVDVRNHFIRLTQDQARAGVANAALARSGLHQLAALNDQNAATLWQAIVELGGQ